MVLDKELLVFNNLTNLDFHFSNYIYDKKNNLYNSLSEILAPKNFEEPILKKVKKDIDGDNIKDIVFEEKERKKVYYDESEGENEEDGLKRMRMLAPIAMEYMDLLKTEGAFLKEWEVVYAADSYQMSVEVAQKNGYKDYPTRQTIKTKKAITYTISLTLSVLEIIANLAAIKGNFAKRSQINKRITELIDIFGDIDAGDMKTLKKLAIEEYDEILEAATNKKNIDKIIKYDEWAIDGGKKTASVNRIVPEVIDFVGDVDASDMSTIKQMAMEEYDDMVNPVKYIERLEKCDEWTAYRGRIKKITEQTKGGIFKKITGELAGNYTKANTYIHNIVTLAGKIDKNNWTKISFAVFGLLTDISEAYYSKEIDIDSWIKDYRDPVKKILINCLKKEIINIKESEIEEMYKDPKYLDKIIEQLEETNFTLTQTIPFLNTGMEVIIFKKDKEVVVSIGKNKIDDIVEALGELVNDEVSYKDELIPDEIVFLEHIKEKIYSVAEKDSKIIFSGYNEGGKLAKILFTLINNSKLKNMECKAFFSSRDKNIQGFVNFTQADIIGLRKKEVVGLIRSELKYNVVKDTFFPSNMLKLVAFYTGVIAIATMINPLLGAILWGISVAATLVSTYIKNDNILKDAEEIYGILKHRNIISEIGTKEFEGIKGAITGNTYEKKIELEVFGVDLNEETIKSKNIFFEFSTAYYFMKKYGEKNNNEKINIPYYAINYKMIKKDLDISYISSKKVSFQDSLILFTKRSFDDYGEEHVEFYMLKKMKKKDPYVITNKYSGKIRWKKFTQNGINDEKNKKEAKKNILENSIDVTNQELDDEINLNKADRDEDLIEKLREKKEKDIKEIKLLEEDIKLLEDDLNMVLCSKYFQGKVVGLDLKEEKSDWEFYSSLQMVLKSLKMAQKNYVKTKKKNFSYYLMTQDSDSQIFDENPIIFLDESENPHDKKAYFFDEKNKVNECSFVPFIDYEGKIGTNKNGIFQLNKLREEYIGSFLRTIFAYTPLRKSRFNVTYLTRDDKFSNDFFDDKYERFGDEFKISEQDYIIRWKITEDELGNIYELIKEKYKDIFEEFKKMLKKKDRYYLAKCWNEYAQVSIEYKDKDGGFDYFKLVEKELDGSKGLGIIKRFVKVKKNGESQFSKILNAIELGHVDESKDNYQFRYNANEVMLGGSFEVEIRYHKVLNGSSFSNYASAYNAKELKLTDKYKHLLGDVLFISYSNSNKIEDCAVVTEVDDKGNIIKGILPLKRSKVFEEVYFRDIQRDGKNIAKYIIAVGDIQKVCLPASIDSFKSNWIGKPAAEGFDISNGKTGVDMIVDSNLGIGGKTLKDDMLSIYKNDMEAGNSGWKEEKNKENDDSYFYRRLVNVKKYFKLKGALLDFKNNIG